MESIGFSEPSSKALLTAGIQLKKDARNVVIVVERDTTLIKIRTTRLFD